MATTVGDPAAPAAQSQCSLYIQFIAQLCKEADLHALLSPFGHVLSVQFEEAPQRHQTVNQALKAAVVLFSDRESAWNVFYQLDGVFFMGETIRILPPREDTWAVPDEQAYTTAPASAVHSAPFPSPSKYTEHRPWQQFPTAHEDSAFTHIPAAFGPAVTAADEISLLPPVEEVARKGKLTHTFYSAQLLVSFKTKQGDKVVSTALLRNLFSNIGQVTDVQIKHNEYDPYYGVQHGYGFLHFPRTWEGIQQAVVAPNVFKHRTVQGVLFDVNVSHQLHQFLAALKDNYHIDLVAYFSSSAPGAATVAALQLRMEHVFDNVNTYAGVSLHSQQGYMPEPNFHRNAAPRGGWTSAPSAPIGGEWRHALGYGQNNDQYYNHPHNRSSRQSDWDQIARHSTQPRYSRPVQPQAPLPTYHQRHDGRNAVDYQQVYPSEQQLAAAEPPASWQFANPHASSRSGRPRTEDTRFNDSVSATVGNPFEDTFYSGNAGGPARSSLDGWGNNMDHSTQQQDYTMDDMTAQYSSFGIRK